MNAFTSSMNTFSSLSYHWSLNTTTNNKPYITKKTCFLNNCKFAFLYIWRFGTRMWWMFIKLKMWLWIRPNGRKALIKACSVVQQSVIWISFEELLFHGRSTRNSTVISKFLFGTCSGCCGLDMIHEKTKRKRLFNFPLQIHGSIHLDAKQTQFPSTGLTYVECAHILWDILGLSCGENYIQMLDLRKL